MSFWVLSGRNDGAVLDAYPEGPEGWRYLEPQPLAREFRAGSVMGFSPSFPERRKVYDFINNVLRLQVVSERVRRVVIELAPNDVEFLPITLVDHNKDVVSREHFIMNLLHRREVIDLEHSDVVMSSILKAEIQFVQGLALKQDIPSEGPHAFRPVYLRSHTFVDAVLRDALVQAGLKGCRFLPAHGWDGDED
ncbi:imm11 family protein [Myxococcus sp. RHSTA-1-4]|uniref:imm11 family protein n=1 Tax=Myxococcus sp. RHSTA-1-4 TaxID=2874601 RepID=UPI001CBFCE3B|nr:DUF1629 domain-containing protein [Myxococcus sp. RHSTA-1-4]MBZ4420560.1 hypothetical protein [Myxococcus sp. RHSTA-1-4]